MVTVEELYPPAAPGRMTGGAGYGLPLLWSVAGWLRLTEGTTCPEAGYWPTACTGYGRDTGTDGGNPKGGYEGNCVVWLPGVTVRPCEAP